MKAAQPSMQDDRIGDDDDGTERDDVVSEQHGPDVVDRELGHEADEEQEAIDVAGSACAASPSIEGSPGCPRG